MPDVVDAATRSRMMAGIKGKNTKPEFLIRRGLHRLGFRFRIHSAQILGKPDLILPKYNAIIFVHGCFWHGHDCSLFKLPQTRQEFWRAKIAANRIRDELVVSQLLTNGWRCLTIWECALRGRARLGTDETVSRTSAWIVSTSVESEIRSSI